jgi:hypothetical protein
VKLVEDRLIDEGVEESHLIGAMIQDVLDAELDAPLNEVHIIIQISEGDFRLNHPELTRVARGVALFGAEGRAKGVDILEGHRKGFDVELTRNGQGSPSGHRNH